MKAGVRLPGRGIAAAAVAVVSAGLAAVLSALAITKAGMPYNEQGRYFDGEVVHHADAVLVFGGLAGVLWLVAVAVGLWAFRVFRKTGPWRATVPADRG